MTIHPAQFRAEGSIASLAPTVARLFAAPMPALASEPPLASVLGLHQRSLDGQPVERGLVFCPDALGVNTWRPGPPHWDAIGEYARLRIPLLSVVPPKTPVCFASIFTGGRPCDHGVVWPGRPVLKCDTLFDVLRRAGKRIAIVAVAHSSVDRLFRERDLDYFPEKYDGEVAERALGLIGQDRHDLIVAYQQEFDDLLHRNDPFSEVCVQAVAHHVRDFAALARAARKAWAGRRHAIVFAPDHGGHVDPATGRGDHGLDIPEDMHLFHWYGLHAART
jgi:hypothetical protein